jgi:PAS domain S-box-containing protein
MIADRDTLQQAHQRLEQLYDISKIHLRFRSVEETVPEEIAVVAQALPLRSAVFINETGGVPRTMVWQAAGDQAATLEAAKARARRAYTYLARAVEDLEHGPEVAIMLPPAIRPASSDGEGESYFVVLPLVVEGGPIFGALQIESVGKLDELALIFMNTVVNQLAIALQRHAANRAVVTSEAKLSGIISTSADAIISIDEAQRIVMYNDGARQIFGWSREEALGQSFDLLLPERLRKGHRKEIQRFAAGSATALKMGDRQGPIMGLRKDGQEFPWQAAISKLSADGGWLFTIVLRDITEQKRIEQEERFLVEVGSVLATSLDSRQTLVNIAHLTLRELGDFCVIEFADEEGELRQPELFTSEPAKEGICEAWNRLPWDRSHPHLGGTIFQTNEPQVLATVSAETIRALTTSDEHRALLTAVGPTSMMGVPLNVHGQVLGRLVVGSCGSGKRYGAVELRLLTQIGHRAALALENARLYAATQRAVQDRDNVLAIVVHDVRNPLGAILIQAEKLARLGVETAGIERAATRIDRLIQDLLDVTRMQAGQLSIRRGGVPAGRVILEAIRSQEEMATSRTLELTVDVTERLPTIWADQDRLLQVFENLIGNAVKFTDRGGQITVGARAREKEVVFWVADTGAGISDDEIPHLFDRFWQARRGCRGGAGLGLPIVKGLIQAHGGDIWVESAPGKGSTFYFTIPIAPAVDVEATGVLPHDRH